MTATAVIAAGLKHKIVRTVGKEHLASHLGSGLAPVLATPALVAFCEECARLTVDPLLREGQQTVGTVIHLRHLAPTPEGAKVTVQTELTETEGPRLRFRVEAWDEVELIAEADHERFVVDENRFRLRSEAKARGKTR